MFLHAANDYRSSPDRFSPPRWIGVGCRIDCGFYPTVGTTPAEGHAFVYSGVGVWESDVFAFLDEYVSSAKPTAHVSPP